MTESTQVPFQSFMFTLVQNKMPRASLKLTQKEDDLFELHVQKGSAANPSMQFTRLVPTQTAVRLRDVLQDAGVFGWEESYGDSRAPGSMRWTLSVVFKEGVFSIASGGGSDTPHGFERVLDELYRLDFPRPNNARAQGQPATRTVPGADFNKLSDALGASGLEGIDVEQMAKLMGEAQANPQALQARMREEFAHMSKDEQENLLDTLASTGMASRAWWERFLRG